MGPAQELDDLHPGDRVRVLGWLDGPARSLDVVADVQDAVSRSGDFDSASATLVPVDGPTPGFADALPDGLGVGDRLELFVMERPDGGWTEPEVRVRDTPDGSFSVVGTVHHIERAADR